MTNTVVIAAEISIIIHLNPIFDGAFLQNVGDLIFLKKKNTKKNWNVTFFSVPAFFFRFSSSTCQQ